MWEIILAIFCSVVLIELAFVLYSLSKLFDAIAEYYRRKADNLSREG
ncbi:MAG: hypothetical protein ACP5JF_00030 [Candidatus Methanodesulfokora sp.]|jgi:hypothetical protein